MPLVDSLGKVILIKIEMLKISELTRKEVLCNVEIIWKK